MKNLLYILTIVALFVGCTRETTSTYERFMFRTDGADIAVEVNGNMASKTFVLLLHGGPGGGGLAYNSGYYSEQLEKDFAIVYMDQRGNGSSTGNYDKESLTIAQNSKDVYQLVMLLKAKYGSDISLFLAGHSWGGLTSCHALLETPLQDEIKGWIEIDGAHDFVRNDIEAVKLFLVLAEEELTANRNADFWSEVKERVEQIDTNNINDDDRGYLNSKGFEAEAKLDIYNPDTSGNNEGNYGLKSPDLSLSGYVANQFINPILNEDSQKLPLTSRLSEIEVPCLFLWGKYDLVVPPALGEDAYNRVNTADKKLVVYEHSGHSPMVNEPGAFVNEVKNFIDQYK